MTPTVTGCPGSSGVIDTAESPTPVPQSRGREQRARLRGVTRVLGAVLVAAGVLALVWVLVVWKWGDPVTGLYARYQQRALESEYRDLAGAYERRALPGVAGTSPAAKAPGADTVLLGLRREGARYRRGLDPGDPVGVIDVPRLGLHAVVVNGTGHGDLQRGPGRDLRTFVPGEGRLVYIAGHRTTYGAPLAHIDDLRPGDVVRVSLPYAQFTYVVTGHRIVEADALSVLRPGGTEHLALQACHPRFFASERYIADARLSRVSVRLGRDSWRTYVVRSA